MNYESNENSGFWQLPTTNDENKMKSQVNIDASEFRMTNTFGDRKRLMNLYLNMCKTKTAMNFHQSKYMMNFRSQTKYQNKLYFTWTL